jgi:hypothetical protein
MSLLLREPSSSQFREGRSFPSQSASQAHLHLLLEQALRVVHMLPSATATTHPPPAGIVPAIVSLSVYLIYDLIPAHSKTSSDPLQCIPFLLTFDVRMMVEDQSPLNKEATAYCALILEECFLLLATTHSSTACEATRRTSNPPLSNPSTSILAACYTQGHQHSHLYSTLKSYTSHLLGVMSVSTANAIVTQGGSTRRCEDSTGALQ